MKKTESVFKAEEWPERIHEGNEEGTGRERASFGGFPHAESNVGEEISFVNLPLLHPVLLLDVGEEEIDVPAPTSKAKGFRGEGEAKLVQAEGEKGGEAFGTDRLGKGGEGEGEGGGDRGWERRVRRGGREYMEGRR